MGLASLLTSKDVYVMTPHGKRLLEEDMEQILHYRYLSYKNLAAGKRIKGPKPFTEEDQECFSQTLDKLLKENCKT